MLNTACHGGKVTPVCAIGFSPSCLRSACEPINTGRKVFSRPVISCSSSSDTMKVLVTGASGRTGSLVVKKLLERKDDFAVQGLVRSEKSAEKLMKETGIGQDAVCMGDITEGSEGLKKAMEGCQAVILCTSAIPQLIPWSIFPVIWAKITGQEGVRPQFKFPEGQEPEKVDWVGAKVQIDAAKESGVKKFVFVSSMGGTQPDNFLNTMGNGNILLWKRKAEEYLIQSGLEYTIIHPGGLTLDEGGARQLVLGVDDTLIGPDVPRDRRRIPRADVAELCVQSLLLEEAVNRSVDVTSKEPGKGPPTTDFQKLFAEMSSNCNYSVANQPATM
mmetsp:Transcript_8757/g.25223  ORF Transcript_8757/g.25223 Transcript_8757/m.25223 type:complete len:331 (-) Transcript_8757:188-1180(-)